MALYSNLFSLSLSPPLLSLKKNVTSRKLVSKKFVNFCAHSLELLKYLQSHSYTLEFYKTQTRQGTWKAQNYGGFFPPERGGGGGGGIERRGSVATGSRNFSWLAWFIACKSVNKSKPCVAGLRVCRCAPWGRSQLIKNPKIIDRVMDILCTRAAHFASRVRLIFTSAVGYRLFVVRLFGRENYPVNRGIITRKKRGMMDYGYGV